MKKNLEEVKFTKLIKHILELSEATDFSIAKHEWKFVALYIDETFTHCKCGKQIKEVCIIKNIHNNKETGIGNICVNKFLGINMDSIFKGLKKLVKDKHANPNEDLITYAYQQGYITNWDYRFLCDTHKKRKFSEKQLALKLKINKKIIKPMVKNMI